MRNLAQGKNVSVAKTACGVINACETFLTNGITGNLSVPSAWLSYEGGIAVELTVDLGNIFAVDGFDIGFLHDKNSNICCPDKLEFLLSADGKSFYLAETVSAPYPASFELKTRAAYKSQFKNPFAARFAKLKFGIDGIVCCDEWRIFGSDAIGTESEIASCPAEQADKNAFAPRDSLGTSCDIALLNYADLSEQGSYSRLAYTDFISCLAYLDKNGNASGVMFDTVALCQSAAGNCPSGGCLTNCRNDSSRLSDWEWLIDELFAKDANLKALDTAAFDVKAMLGLQRDYKFKVFLTAPMPKTSFDVFGDMNGDGIEEKLLTTEDCVSAFAWYVDAVSRRFNAECLQNIEIAGFVWGENRITRKHRDDAEHFATSCVSQLKARGYKSLFTASYMADGCDKAESIGFDCTAMQYNGEEESLASTCQKYGFGVCLAANISDTAAIRQQLNVLADNGMMSDTVHIYNSADSLCGCAFSQEKPLREIYDNLYKFVNGIYGQVPDLAIPEETAEIPEIIAPEEEAPQIAEPPPEACETATDTAEPVSVKHEPEISEPITKATESEIKIRIEIESEKEDKPPRPVPPPPSPPPEPRCVLNQCIRRKKYKKYVSLGIGIAAAVGAAYIITKITKGKNNG